MNPCSDVLFATLITDLESYIELPGSADEVAIKSLKNSILKKFQDSKSPTASLNAISLFLDNNTRCKTHFDPFNLDSEIQVIIGEARASFYNDFYCNFPSCLKLYSNMQFGPGASVKSLGTSFYHKMISPRYTCTSPDLYKDFRKACVLVPRLNEFLNSAISGQPACVCGSNLTTVPKNYDIDRVICTEPLLNMFFQKGVEHYLLHLLRKCHNIDITTQAIINKRLARSASIDGELSTIDLSSASDTISMNFCKWFLPESLFELLTYCRSPSTVLPNGDIVELHMISSMGNATTFPLQTLIFSYLARATLKITGNHTSNTYGVFGDDIIVPTGIYNVMCRVLHSCGFTVNQTKSFSSGYFRESCGGDFYRGRNVRGVYCYSLQTPHDTYSLINRLNFWSARHKILLINTIRYLKSFVRDIRVPPYEDDSYGIKVPYAIADKTKSYYRIYSQSVKQIDVNAFDDFQKEKLPYSPELLLVSMVKGTFFGGYLTFRGSKFRSRYYRKNYPCWDFLPMASDVLTSEEFKWWQYTTLCNLEEVT